MNAYTFCFELPANCFLGTEHTCMNNVEISAVNKTKVNFRQDPLDLIQSYCNFETDPMRVTGV